uniref:heme o synthase n=1 Tax=Candidatus Planktophila sp. TaxID=2175601 RepID=UPI004049C0AC
MTLVRAYIALMKLRVVELLLISTIPAMILAQQGIPDAALVLATLFGGTLAAGSANAFNMVLESDLDQLMKRTSKRPLVTGVIRKSHAVIFASAIGLLSLIIFWFLTTPLATFFTAVAIGFYIFIYTMTLKRHTSQNIVWGGAAGCMPVLIGWAAVTNSISWVAVAFFFVIFFWTPPHFWALAIKYKDDYEAASIPMLPVIAARTIVLKNMWFYTVAMIASSVALIYLADLQWWAMVVTVGLGLVFAFQLVQLKEDSENYNYVAAKIFHWSITYLTLFSALLVSAQLLNA